MLPLCPRRTGQDVGGAGLKGEFGRLPGAGPAAAEPHPARGQQRDAADLAERRRIAVPADPRAGRVARHEQVRQLNAELFGIAAETGTIEPGQRADLLVVDGDPLADIAVLQHPDNLMAIVKEGQFHKRQI